MPVLSISPELALAFLGWLQYRADTQPGDLNILGLQGCRPTTSGGAAVEPCPNTPDEYNDSIVFLHRDPADGWRAECYLGTTDPGSGPALNREGGQAHLAHGQHQYVLGTHPQHLPNGAVVRQPALNAWKGINRAVRDVNRNQRQDQGDRVQEGVFGMNVHWGASSGTRIGNWSEGCVNLYGGLDGAPWKRTLELTRRHLAHRETVALTIWAASDLARFATAVPGLAGDLRPTLSYGMLGPWVATLQGLLIARGHLDGKADGDWRDATERAVRAFQASAGLVVDGIAGTGTWGGLVAK